MDTVVVGVHASAALVSLIVGAAQLLRRHYGDPQHRRIGRVWVGAMYVTLVSSFLVQDLRPGAYTLFHALSVFTFCTLTTGVVAAARGDVALHLRMMTGSWLGVVGAFVGAVAVPTRTLPQLAVHQPLLLAGWVAAGALASYVLLAVGPSRSSLPGPLRHKAEGERGGSHRRLAGQDVPTRSRTAQHPDADLPQPVRQPAAGAGAERKASVPSSWT